jgi:hypothetical protein
MFHASQEFSKPALVKGGAATATGITMGILGTGYRMDCEVICMWEKVKVIPGFRFSTPTMASGPLFFCVGPGYNFAFCLP